RLEKENRAPPRVRGLAIEEQNGAGLVADPGEVVEVPVRLPHARERRRAVAREHQAYRAIERFEKPLSPGNELRQWNAFADDHAPSVSTWRGASRPSLVEHSGRRDARSPDRVPPKLVVQRSRFKLDAAQVSRQLLAPLPIRPESRGLLHSRI